MSEKKPPVSSAVLRQQKKDTEDQLNDLRQKQVDALEEGAEFEHNSDILVLSERISALNKAIARADAREAEEEARRARAEERDTIAEMKENLQKSIDEYLVLFSDAEAAFKLFIGSYVSICEKAGDLSRQSSMIGAFLRRNGQLADEPTELSDLALSARFGDYASWRLRPARAGITGGRGDVDRIGALRWGNVQSMATSWRDAESNYVIPPGAHRLKTLDRVLDALQEPADDQA